MATIAVGDVHGNRRALSIFLTSFSQNFVDATRW